MRTTILFFLAITLLSAACNKPAAKNITGVQDCSDPQLYPYFPGYQYAEVSSVTCRTFVKDSAFDQLISEQTLAVDSFSTPYQNVLTRFELKPGFDYELIISATHDTFKIARINMVQRSEAYSCPGNAKICPAEICINEFKKEDVYFVRNGEAITPITYETTFPGNTYFIKFKRY